MKRAPLNMSINRELNRLISVYHQSSRRLIVPLNHPTKGAASLTYQTFEVFVRVFGASSFTKNSRGSAPSYQMLPTETDLNIPPLVSSIPDKAIPADYLSLQPRTSC